MLRPMPLDTAPRYPAAAGTCLAAIVISLFGFSQRERLAPLVAGRDWTHEPWTLVTTMFPHGGVLHLVFNVYWVWTLAGYLEQRWGPARTLGVLVFTGAVGTLCQLAVNSSGIGLSGAVYGLFGLLWVLSRQPGKHYGIVDEHTTRLFVGWFFLCIVLTQMNLLAIANAAHFGGALAGFTLGHAVAARKPRDRWLARAACVGWLLVAGVLAWPGLIRSPGYDGVLDDWERGSARYDDADFAGAIQAWERAVREDPAEWKTRHNLALAYERAGRPDDAIESLQAAVVRGADRASRLYLTDLLYARALASINASSGRLTGPDAADLRAVLELDIDDAYKQQAQELLDGWADPAEDAATATDSDPPR